MAFDSCLLNVRSSHKEKNCLPVMRGYRVYRVSDIFSVFDFEYVVTSYLISFESSKKFCGLAREHGSTNQLNMTSQLRVDDHLVMRLNVTIRCEMLVLLRG